jgi:hypothetical protein
LQVSYFEKRPILRTLSPAAAMADASVIALPPETRLVALATDLRATPASPSAQVCVESNGAGRYRPGGEAGTDGLQTLRWAEISCLTAAV